MIRFEKFLNDTLGQKELLTTYIELRQLFREYGWTNEDLVNPPKYTHRLMELKERFNDEKNALFKQVNDYGFDVSLDDFHAYLTPLFIKINELTPLEDGNNERNDSRNEDN